MRTFRLAFSVAAGFAAAVCAQAQEVGTGSRVVLVCPDRSPRMADIELAVSAGHMRVSQAGQRHMLERTRSVCAAGLSAVTLVAPADAQLAPDTALASEPAKQP
jgi:hypothetical protein